MKKIDYRKELKTETITYVSTQVYGYDDKGLVLQFFDTAGAFEFRAATKDNGIRFEWKDGENWKRSDYWPEQGGKIHFRYDSMEPTLSKDVAKFEGIWLPGKRPTTL